MFGDIIVWRTMPNPIIKVSCTKPKDESLKTRLIKKKMEYENIEFVYAHEFVKYLYNEWIHIQDVID